MENGCTFFIDYIFPLSLELTVLSIYRKQEDHDGPISLTWAYL